MSAEPDPHRSPDGAFRLVYEELRRLARLHLSGSARGRTLDTTALIHEAYIRLADVPSATFESPKRFYAYASRVMRSVLVDHARARSALKRGSGRAHVTLDEGVHSVAEQGEQLLALDDALDRLAREHARLATVVECRFFGGMTEPEIAETLGVTERTVRRDWLKARVWLHEQLSHE
jgi:RNA polymerase sigma factor (TIGR02999 family)